MRSVLRVTHRWVLRGRDSSQEFGMTGWGSLRDDRVVGCWNDRG